MNSAVPYYTVIKVRNFRFAVVRQIARRKANGLDLNPRCSFLEDTLSWFHLSKNLLLNISNDQDATEFYLDPKKGKIKGKILDKFINIEKSGIYQKFVSGDRSRLEN